MAVSMPHTPKSNPVTPRKKFAKNPVVDSPFRHSNAQFATPRNTRTAAGSFNSIPNTPECFNMVTVEPLLNSTSKRTSEDRLSDRTGQESNLTVAVRVRPMNTRELTWPGVKNAVKVKNQDLIIRSSASSNLDTVHTFQYDHIFWSCEQSSPQYTSQQEVFNVMGKPLLDNAFRGYNACLFAYGQTGSGKSFSMMGRNACEVVDIDSDEDSGITPRFCRELFSRISELEGNFAVTVEVSYFEIYNEKIHDLLAQSLTTKTALKVREHPEWGPYVVDLTIHPVKTYEELRDWLLLGNRNRATAATVMNENSSRSHSIFSIEICITSKSDEMENSTRSKVNLVDLAGSERLVTAHNTEEKMRQGVSINKSLLTLGKVITALADQRKNQFVPYRDSVLTWLLRESLGGNSLTSMLATITPASSYLDETLATLRYACQARSIVNRARINESPHDRLIRELRSEVERLKALKENYELNNSQSPVSHCRSDKQELERLRRKLDAAEHKLEGAEEIWSQRFKECAQSQLEKLAESEKRREELESKMRILNTSNTNLDLSLYTTNFLDELESILFEKNGVLKQQINNVVDWCQENEYSYDISDTSINIEDCSNQRKGFLPFTDLKNVQESEDVCKFVCWQNPKKLSKGEVLSSLNVIYKELHNLKPAETDNNLNLLFAKVNKSLQSFEAALVNHVSKNNSQKTVTFNL